MGQLTKEQDYSYRIKQGWPHFLNDLRVVDEKGAELARDGKAQGILQIRGHNVIQKYHKVRRRFRESSLSTFAWRIKGCASHKLSGLAAQSFDTYIGKQQQHVVLNM